MDQPLRTIFTVSQLTASIKKLLENTFPFVWITGEISNFTEASSGHYYFTIKDEKARIQAVMFKGQNRSLRFIPQNGMKITGLGRIAVYEPRGAYQLILEMLDPKGLGDLQAAFDALKKKLSEEGLFDDAHKKELPFMPKKIGLVTSPTGAVIKDFFNVVNRRFPNVAIYHVPVKVQGTGADDEIANAVSMFNETPGIDVIVIARGGGSLEDLQPFNSEKTARAVFESRIPVVSAVGHETDYTIADFVSDLRAPTPSAAAEIVVPLWRDVKERLMSLDYYLSTYMLNVLANKRNTFQGLMKRLKRPEKRIADKKIHVDDLEQRLSRALRRKLETKHRSLENINARLLNQNPKKHVVRLREEKIAVDKRFTYGMNQVLNRKRMRFSLLHEKLMALSPLSVLDRGYSITVKTIDNSIVTDASSVKDGEPLDVILKKGRLNCLVTTKSKNEG